ncbi:FAD-dependent thymidylate synthase [Candidatus Parcubacteria bacterium]|nr:FAD-dependent thymidylate synthase [Candidatus Parcubacteria bacterium]
MVKIGFIEDEPIILAAVGVKISQTPFEQGSIQDIYEECRGSELEKEAGKLKEAGNFEGAKKLKQEVERRIENSKKLVNEIMIKHRHLILGDFLPYTVALEDISRLAAIYLWRNVNVLNFVFGAGIEASFRVIKPNRYNKAVSDLGKIAFEAYEKAVDLGVPEQDARYMLPEGILTRMIFSSTPRYLGKLANSSKNAPLSEFKEIGKQIETLVKEKFGLELLQETLPSEWKFWGQEKIKEGISLDYQGKIHSFSLNMGVKGSLAMYAQLVRQRLLLCDVEPLEGISKKGRFVVPFTFPRATRKDYQEIASQAKQKQIESIERHEQDFVYYLLLGQEAEAIIYGKGATVIETSQARSEGVAQWEIRNQVGIPITRELAKYKELETEIGPRCWREKQCIEPGTFKTKKSICKAFFQAEGNWKGTLKELLDTLTEHYETFRV